MASGELGRLYETSEKSMGAYTAVVSAGHVETFARMELAIRVGRREGARFWDAYTGESFWDLHRGGSLYALGHRHPHVVAALTEAIVGGADIGNFLAISDYRSRLAESLLATTDARHGGVTITTNGGQANELAIHAVRRFTERRQIVGISDISYAGGTATGTQLADDGVARGRRERWSVVADPDTTFVPFDDLATMGAAISDTTAAVFMETSPAQGGFPTPRADYLAGVRALCDEAGAMLVFDEIQVGLGTSGDVWSFESSGVTPDVFTTAKGLGGGLLPVGAAVMTKPLWTSWTAGALTPNADTYSGSDLGCITALAVLEVIRAEGYLEQIRESSEAFEKALDGIEGWTLGGVGLNRSLRPDTGRIGDGISLSRRLRDEGVFAMPSFDVPALLLRIPGVVTPADATEIAVRVRQAL